MNFIRGHRGQNSHWGVVATPCPPWNRPYEFAKDVLQHSLGLVCNVELPLGLGWV